MVHPTDRIAPMSSRRRASPRISDSMAADAVLAQVGTDTAMSLATKPYSSKLGAGLSTMVKETKKVARKMSARRKTVRRKTTTRRKTVRRKTVRRKTVRRKTVRRKTSRKSPARRRRVVRRAPALSLGW